MSANKWPKRLALTGAIILALSTAVMWSSYDEMTGILDPGKNHFLELEEGQTEDVNLSNSTSYLIFRLNNVAADCHIIENHTGTEVGLKIHHFFKRIEMVKVADTMLWVRSSLMQVGCIRLSIRQTRVDSRYGLSMNMIWVKMLNPSTSSRVDVTDCCVGGVYCQLH